MLTSIFDQHLKPARKVSTGQDMPQIDDIEQDGLISSSVCNSENSIGALISKEAHGMSVFSAMSSYLCSNLFIAIGGQTSFLRHQILQGGWDDTIMASARNGSLIAVGLYMNRVNIYMPNQEGFFSLYQDLWYPSDPQCRRSLVFSSDGSMLVGWGSFITIWCVNEQGAFQETQRIKFTDLSVREVVISPNCQMIAAVTDVAYQEISIWKTKSNVEGKSTWKTERLGTFSLRAVVEGDRPFCFSPDSLGLIVRVDFRLWFHTLDKLGGFVSSEVIGSNPRALACFPLGFFSKRGRRFPVFITRNHAREFFFWDGPESENCVSPLPSGPLRAACISATGEKLAVLLSNGSLQLWEPDSAGDFQMAREYKYAFEDFYGKLLGSNDLFDTDMFFSADGRSVVKVRGRLIVTKELQ